MGQDTYAGVGVATEIKLTFSNLPLIVRVLECPPHTPFNLTMDCYCHTSDCEDETEDLVDRVRELCLIHDGKFPDQVIDYLRNIKNDTEFNTLLRGIGLSDGSPLHCMIDVIGYWAHNISRR